jgi:hypothetical protein
MNLPCSKVDWCALAGLGINDKKYSEEENYLLTV